MQMWGAFLSKHYKNAASHLGQFPYISRHSTSIYMVIKTAFEVHMTCIAVPCVLINHS